MPPPNRPSRTTLFKALQSAARKVGPDRPAVSDASGTLTFAALIDSSMTLASRLKSSTAERETIGAYQLSGVQTLQLLFAASISGRSIAFLDPLARGRSLLNACRTTCLRRIICSAEVRNELARLLRDESFADLRTIATAADDLLRPPTIFERIAARWRAFRSGATPMPSDPPVAVFFSQDAIGLTQGTLATERNLLAAFRQAWHRRVWAADDVTLCTQPMHQNLALVLGLLGPVLAGAHAVVVRHPRAYHGIVRAIRELRATVLIASPAHLRAYGQAARAEDFAYLSGVISIGEPLSKHVGEMYRDKFALLIKEGFGTAGAVGLVALSNGDMGWGGGPMRLMRGTKVKLVATRERLRRGGIHIRGPQVAAAMLVEHAPGLPQPVSSTLGPAWRSTGEVFDVLPHRYVRWIADRGPYLHVAGATIPLKRTEALAQGASPEHTHAAVIDDSRSRQAIILFTTDPALERSRLLELADALGEPRIVAPRRIVHARALPTNAAGRIDYDLLRRYAATRAEPALRQPPVPVQILPDRESEPNPNESVAAVTAIVGRGTEADGVALPQRLETLFSAINDAFDQEVTEQRS